MHVPALPLAASLLLLTAQAVDSQTVNAPAAWTYADLADVALGAPVVAHVRVDSRRALSSRETPNVAPGHRRFLIEASVVALIRGEGGLPAKVAYLVDLPNRPDGRAAQVPRRSEYLLLASRVPGRPDELRLVARDAHIPFSEAAASRLRGLLAEVSGPEAAPAITGVGRAFHVPGSLPGESETQIFLQTEDQRPISISILRRPGEQPRWSVALGEIVDAAASRPEPESLLWYRLACGLPPSLPAQAIQDASPQESRAIADDYRLVLESLGACARSRAE